MPSTIVRASPKAPLLATLLATLLTPACGRNSPIASVSRPEGLSADGLRTSETLVTKALDVSPSKDEDSAASRKDASGSEVREEAVKAGLFGLTTNDPLFLSFEKRLDRLSNLADATALQSLRSEGRDFGAYDFGASRPPANSWSVNALEGWLGRMKGLCESGVLARHYAKAADFDAFFLKATGRVPEADDKAALAGILQATDIDDATKRSLVCRAVLSSAEFNHANAQDLRGALGEELTGDDYVRYLRRLAPTFVGRSLGDAERKAVREGGLPAVRATLTAWIASPAFQPTIRDFANRLLSLNGKKGDVNLDEPANLLVRLASRKEPYHGFFSANHCVNDAGEATSCDSGAPHPAGFLTTRAFLSGLYSRFNLKRARKVAALALCADYPIAEAWQPRVQKEKLIPMFGAKDAAEAAAAGADAAGFGNGTACHTCHGQFAAHAQFFVKFNAVGRYVADANGLQAANLQTGESRPGLATSHFRAPEEAAAEFGMLGATRYDNIQEAAKGAGDLPRFWQCQVKHVLAYAFQAPYVTMEAFPPEALAEVVAASGGLKGLSPQEMFVAVLSSDKVIRSALFTGTTSR